MPEEGRGRRRRRRLLGRGHLGVWDPAGGETREGSGLPIEGGPEEIRVLAWPLRGEGRVLEVPPEDLKEYVREGDLAVWVDLLRPKEGSAALLRDALGLGPLMVEDCLKPLRMPKADAAPSVEGDGGVVFVAAFAARLPQDSEEGPRLRAREVDLVVGPGYLVTVRDSPVGEVEERLEALARSGEPHTTPEAPGPALAHAALDAIVDGHLPIMVRCAAEAEELEDALDPDDERASVAALEALIILRRDLLAFRRLAVAQVEAIKRLARALPEEADARLSDVEDNQREAIDMADATRDYVDGAVEAYRMRRDERSERGIRRLTVLAGVIGPLSLLTGIYGVNFANIPGTDAPYGFWVFVGVQVAFLVLAVWYLGRRGLL